MRMVRGVARLLLIALALVTAPLLPLLAQGTTAPDASGLDVVCLAYGAVTSIAITLLKSIPFIARNPKWVALICSIVVAGAQAWYHGALPSVGTLVACVLTQLSGAVATHEIAVKTVQGAVGV